MKQNVLCFEIIMHFITMKICVLDSKYHLLKCHLSSLINVEN